MASQNEKFAELRAIAIAAMQEAKTAHDLANSHVIECIEFRKGIQADIRSLLLITAPAPKDPWRDYWRAATGGLMALVLTLVIAFGSNLVNKQDATGKIVGEISERGAQDRNDIKDMKQDLKNTKAEVGLSHDAILRLEARP